MILLVFLTCLEKVRHQVIIINAQYMIYREMWTFNDLPLDSVCLRHKMRQGNFFSVQNNSEYNYKMFPWWQRLNNNYETMLKTTFKLGGHENPAIVKLVTRSKNNYFYYNKVKANLLCTFNVIIQGYTKAIILKRLSPFTCQQVIS